MLSLPVQSPLWLSVLSLHSGCHSAGSRSSGSTRPSPGSPLASPHSASTHPACCPSRLSPPPAFALVGALCSLVPAPPPSPSHHQGPQQGEPGRGAHGASALWGRCLRAAVLPSHLGFPLCQLPCSGSSSVPEDSDQSGLPVGQKAHMTLTRQLLSLPSTVRPKALVAWCSESREFRTAYCLAQSGLAPSGIRSQPPAGAGPPQPAGQPPGTVLWFGLRPPFPLLLR